MFKSGLLDEIKKLKKLGVSDRRLKEFGFEYKAVLEYLAGGLDRKELTEKIAQDTYSYAKQQIRWFKRNREINWGITPAQFHSTGKG